MPEFGNEFLVVGSEKIAKKIALENATKLSDSSSNANMSGSELIRMMNRKTQLNELNVIVKADVKGSLTSIIDSIRTLDTEEVAVSVVGSGVGTITEKDLHLASTSKAIIYGFNVPMTSSIRQLASRDAISIRLYKVIYELIDDVKTELSSLLAPEVVKTELGRMIVKGVFKITKTNVICGGEVTKGKLIIPAMATVSRDGEVIAEVKVVSLKRGPQEAKEILQGEMCGLSFESKSRVDLREGDHLDLYQEEIVERKL